MLLFCFASARLEVQVDQVDDILRIARQCRLVRLITELEDWYKKVVSLRKSGIQNMRTLHILYWTCLSISLI